SYDAQPRRCVFHRMPQRRQDQARRPGPRPDRRRGTSLGDGDARQPAMIVLFLLLAAVCSGAEKTGPAIGARMPDFEAVDQNGNRQTFASLKGPKGLLLLFSRSADWCPFCKGQLQDLNQHLEEYRKRGLGVASVTYDSAAILKNYGARKGIRYPMLSD